MATGRKNENLHLSLSQDLKSLNKLSAEMIQKTNSANVVSWLYPNEVRSHVNDEESPFMQRTDEDRYVSFLEFIVDRLYIIINLINDHLDAMTKAKLQRNILRPKKITLGLSVNVLWQKIQQLDFFLMENQKSTNGKILVKLKEPTALSEPRPRNTICESCQAAMKCVKAVAQEVEALGKSESIPKARSRMREIIFEAPQSEGMNLITTAIVEDVHRLRQIWIDLERKAETTEETSRNLRHEHQEALRKLEVCRNEIGVLEGARLKEKEKRNAMSSLVNKLYHEKHQMEISIHVKEDLMSDLRSTVEKNNEKIYDLQREVDRLQEAIAKAKSFEEILSAEKELWKIRFTNAHKENLKAKATNEELAKELHAVENRIGAIGGDFDKLDEKIERSAEDIDKTKRAYEALLKKTQDVVDSKLIADDNVNENILARKHADDVFPTNDIEVHGNPLIDMTKQVEVNKIAIKQLEAQNERLLKTMRRFKEIARQKDATLHT